MVQLGYDIRDTILEVNGVEVVLPKEVVHELHRQEKIQDGKNIVERCSEECDDDLPDAAYYQIADRYEDAISSDTGELECRIVQNILKMYPTTMSFDDFLGYFEFAYKRYADGYGLIDNTGANLANIEAERFYDPIEMLDRIVEGSYGSDYLLPDEETLQNAGCETEEEYVVKCSKDKFFYNQYLYYANNLDELTNIPPNLSEKA